MTTDTVSFLDSWERGHLQRWCEYEFGPRLAFEVYARIASYILRHQADQDYLLAQGWNAIYQAMQYEEVYGQ